MIHLGMRNPDHQDDITFSIGLGSGDPELNLQLSHRHPGWGFTSHHRLSFCDLPRRDNQVITNDVVWAFSNMQILILCGFGQPSNSLAFFGLICVLPSCNLQVCLFSRTATQEGKSVAWGDTDAVPQVDHSAVKLEPPANVQSVLRRDSVH